MPQHLFTAPQTGPITLKLTVPQAEVHVSVADIERADLALHTAAGVTAEVSHAFDDHGNDATWLIQVPETGSPGKNPVSRVDAGMGVVNVVSGSVTHSTIVQAGDIARVDLSNGQVPAAGGSGVTITVSLPLESSLHLRMSAGAVRISGPLRCLDTDTGAAGIDADAVEQATIHTTSGSVVIGRSDLATVTTVAGDIDIDDFGGTATLTSTSGAIRVSVTEGGDLRATTHSGAIRVTADEQSLAGDRLTVIAQTVSGRVRVPASGKPRRRRAGHES